MSRPPVPVAPPLEHVHVPDEDREARARRAATIQMQQERRDIRTIRHRMVDRLITWLLHDRDVYTIHLRRPTSGHRMRSYLHGPRVAVVPVCPECGMVSALARLPHGTLVPRCLCNEPPQPEKAK